MKKDLTGQKFDMLIVLAEEGRTKAQKTTWKVKCDCGVEKVVVGAALLSGNTKSCGNHNEKYQKPRGKDKPGTIRSNRISVEKIKALLPDYLTFDETTYISGHKPARFIDAVYGEYWSAPRNLFIKHNTKGGCYHPQRYKDTLSDRTSIHVGLKKLAQEKNVPYSTACAIVRTTSLEDFKTYEPAKNLSDLEFAVEKKYGWQHFNQCVVGRYRPDFKAGAVFIDVDGLRFHVMRDKWYHFNKRQAYENAGVTLWQFYPGEILRKQPIILSMLAHKEKTNTKIPARKCVIKEVSSLESQQFFERTHLMGYISRRTIGLYYNNALVAAMSYTQTGDIIDVARFSCELNAAVVGGFSKLINALPKCKKLINWVDLRYGSGKHLESLGFVNEGDVLSWRWTNNSETFNRRQCRANMDDRKLSEAEYAAEKGWQKIYDAGQRKYVKYF